MSINLRLERFESSLGIVPVRTLESKSRIWSSENSPKYDGMPPPIAPFSRLRTFSEAKRDNSEGRAPLRLLFSNTISVMVRSSEQLIPAQLHSWDWLKNRSASEQSDGSA